MVLKISYGVVRFFYRAWFRVVPFVRGSLRVDRGVFGVCRAPAVVALVVRGTSVFPHSVLRAGGPVVLVVARVVE